MAKAAARRPVRRPARRPARRPLANPTPAARRSQHQKPVVAGPSSHELAVETFERGFQSLQQRQFGRASELLGRVVRDFPDEKELQERARVYLVICERQTGGREPKPRSFDERMNAATVAINRGAFDEGLTLLRKLENENPQSDHVQYLLSVVHASAGDHGKALTHLRAAIALNPENRFLSTLDADLEPLRQNAGFASVLAAPVHPPRRAATRRR